MKPGFSPKWLLLFSLALVSWGSLRAQKAQKGQAQKEQAQPPFTYLIPVEMKGQSLRGSAFESQHGDDGTIGFRPKDTEAGRVVDMVVPGSPAATAGLLVGDAILALDGVSIKGLDIPEVLKTIAQKKAGDKIDLTINRNGETKTLTVVVDTRKHLYENDPSYQKNSKAPPAVSQSIFGGSALVIVNLSQQTNVNGNAHLYVSISSKDAPPFEVDDSKFFVLDGTRQQLKHVSLAELKYDIRSDVAKNWRSGQYPPPALPPPPPPPQQYTLSGTQYGNYTITSAGGSAWVTGTSRGTYTATPQPDYSQLGDQSAEIANIQKYYDDKANQKLIEDANSKIAGWEKNYFKGQAPVLTGERRFGEILYSTGSDRNPGPPFRVVLFFTDPRTQKMEAVTFAFGEGAEKIMDEMASQSPAASTSTQPKAAVALTNSDVVGMVKAGISADIIVAKIKNTPCSFDTSPATLKELKDSGLADSVILAMVQAPKN